MTGTTAAHAHGYFHELALYGSDRELVDVVVPFLLGGLDAGEPTLAVMSPEHEVLLQRELGPGSGVSFLPAPAEYARPADAIRSHRARFDDLLAAGAERIRIVGDVPVPAGPRWDEWARYEAAANTAFADYPLWGLCPYDATALTDAVLGDLVAAHPHVAHDGDHHPNPGFVDPARFHEHRPPPDPDPLQSPPPAAVLADLDAATARATAATIAARAGLEARRVEDLLVGVSELVTNAHRHGAPPVLFEAWAGPGRVLVSVTDGGKGPADATVGLQRSGQAVGGLGLWMAHQMADDVVLGFGVEGFTVRAGVGRG